MATHSMINATLKDDTKANVEFELIPGNWVYIEYHGGGGDLYHRWEDLGEDIQEKLKEVHARIGREIDRVFSLLHPASE